MGNGRHVVLLTAASKFGAISSACCSFVCRGTCAFLGYQLSWEGIGRALARWKSSCASASRSAPKWLGTRWSLKLCRLGLKFSKLLPTSARKSLYLMERRKQVAASRNSFCAGRKTDRRRVTTSSTPTLIPPHITTIITIARHTNV